AGAQAFAGPDGQTVVFAVDAFKGWSTPETQEFDVLIDTNGDGKPDFDVFSADLGQLTAGAVSGQMVAAIANLSTNTLSADFLAVAPTDSGVILLPVLAASLGVTADAPRFTYTVQSFDLLSTSTDKFTGSAGFNAFTSAISNGQFVQVAPDQRVSVPVAVDPTEFALTPAKGLMVVTQDNRNGADEAD